MATEENSSQWSFQTTNAALVGELPTASFYQELLIDNRLGRSVFVMRHRGCVETIPSTGSCGGYDPLLVVKVVSRNVKATAEGVFTRHLGDLSGRTLERCEIRLSQLLAGPVFIEALGWSVGLQADTEALKSVNPIYNDSFLDKVIQNMQSDLSTGRSCPVNLYVNLHDPKVTALHLNINGQLLGVKVNHFKDQEEICAVTVRKDGNNSNTSVSTFNIPPRFWEGDKLQCFTVNLAGNDWILGSDRIKVQNLITKTLEENQAKYTKAELETQVLITTREKEAEIAKLKREIDLMKAEASLNKHETDNLKTELSQNDNDVRKSATMAEAEAKIKIAELEAETAKNKAEYEKISAENETLQKRIQLEQDRIKDEMNFRTFEHKERTERYKSNAESFSSTADIVKALAVAIPAIITIFLFIRHPGNSEGAKVFRLFVDPHYVPPVGLTCNLFGMFGTTLASSPWFTGIAALAVLAGTIYVGKKLYDRFKFTLPEAVSNLAGRVKETAKKVCKCIGKTVTTVAKTVKNAAGRIYETVKNVASCAGNFISTVIDKVKTTAGRVIDTVKTVASSVINKAGSLFRNVCNGICSWLFG